MTKLLPILLLGLFVGCAKAPEDIIREKTKEHATAALKAPSTAEFGPITVYPAVDLSKLPLEVTTMCIAKDRRLITVWMTTGYVDAENSFGAKIRTDYDFYFSVKEGEPVVFLYAKWRKR